MILRTSSKIEMLLNEPPKIVSHFLVSTEFVIPPEFRCQQPVAFCWWYLSHVSALFPATEAKVGPQAREGGVTEGVLTVMRVMQVLTRFHEFC